MRNSSFPANEPLETKAKSALQALQAPFPNRGLRLVSPMDAALQTSEALALDCEKDSELRDIDYGSWAGRSLAEIAGESPDSLGRWLSDPCFAEHGGESLEQVVARARNWIEECAAGGANVLAVTHAAVIRAMIVTVLEAPLHAFWHVDIAPATVSEMSNDGRRWTLRSSGLPIASCSRQHTPYCD